MGDARAHAEYMNIRCLYVCICICICISDTYINSILNKDQWHQVQRRHKSETKRIACVPTFDVMECKRIMTEIIKTAMRAYNTTPNNGTNHAYRWI